MFNRRCAWCKRYMECEPGTLFCSDECYSMDRAKRLASEESGPPMRPLDVQAITDEGYIALVKALVSRASQDVRKYKPGTQIRVNAEKFFASDYFTYLTGLNGEAILRKLQEEYTKRKNAAQEKPKPYVCLRVRCIETKVVYPTCKEAAVAFGVSPKMIYNVCKGYNKTASGMHFEYVEE